MNDMYGVHVAKMKQTLILIKEHALIGCFKNLHI